MVSNYLIFFLGYFLIVLSVVGHGVLAIKLTKINVSSKEIGFVGLVGIFFLILYSYITHFFTSHGYIHKFIESKNLTFKNKILLLLIFNQLYVFKFR